MPALELKKYILKSKHFKPLAFFLCANSLFYCSVPRLHFLVLLDARNNQYGRLQKLVVALWGITAPAIIAFLLLAVIPAVQ